jgi:hypothetical protein
LRFRVLGLCLCSAVLRLKVKDSGFRVKVMGFTVKGLGVRVQSFRFRVEGLGSIGKVLRGTISEVGFRI